MTTFLLLLWIATLIAAALLIRSDIKASEETNLAQFGGALIAAATVVTAVIVTAVALGVSALL